MNRLFEYVLKWLMVRKYRELRVSGDLCSVMSEWEQFRSKAMHDLGFWDEVDLVEL